ncbi:MAG: YdcF family protein [Flavobacteriales bacterium]|nr:YdcF family protein [Flavobacteriales bacterium]
MRKGLWHRLKWPVLGIALMGLTIGLGERIIHQHAKGRSYDVVTQAPAEPVALVLGTAAETRGGGLNRYFVSRMRAAAALYHAGKVRHLLLSGDNGTWGYNEPMDMRRTLIGMGVDSTDMTLDFAGFDTYDSVVRAKRIFGQERFMIVSQSFHNERGLFIAREKGIAAVAFNADEAGIRRTKWSWLRERGARVKMWMDILLDVDPHFLGEPVRLGEQVLPAEMPRRKEP